MSTTGPASSNVDELASSRRPSITSRFSHASGGVALTGALADCFGRRKTLRPALLLLFIVHTLTSFSFNYVMLLVTRLVSGVLVSLGLMCGYAYMAESVSARHRQHAVAGFTYAASVAHAGQWLLQRLVGEWRVLVLLNTASMTLLVCLLFLPESPRWLLTRNEPHRARCVLRSVARVNHRQLPDYIRLPCSGRRRRHAMLVRGNFRRVLGRVGRCLSMGDAPCFGFLQNFSLHFAVANFYLR